MDPTKEELAKVEELQMLLKEHLATNGSIANHARQLISKHISDKDFLLKFVRGRKLDLDKALRSIVQYAHIRTEKYPEMFPDEVPDFVNYAIEQQIVSVLRNHDKLGRTVLLFRAANWDVSRMTLEEIFCAGRYIVDELMNEPNFLRKGAVLVTDCMGTSLSQVRQFTPSAVIKFVNVFWQAYPIPIKGLYHVNAPIFVRPVFTLVKPFLPAKLRDRVLITSGVSELYKRIQPDILPEFLGGGLSDYDAISPPFSFSQIDSNDEEETD